MDGTPGHTFFPIVAGYDVQTITLILYCVALGTQLLILGIIALMKLSKRLQAHPSRWVLLGVYVGASQLFLAGGIIIIYQMKVIGTEIDAWTSVLWDLGIASGILGLIAWAVALLSFGSLIKATFGKRRVANGSELDLGEISEVNELGVIDSSTAIAKSWQ